MYASDSAVIVTCGSRTHDAVYLGSGPVAGTVDVLWAERRYTLGRQFVQTPTVDFGFRLRELVLDDAAVLRGQQERCARRGISWNPPVPS